MPLSFGHRAVTSLSVTDRTIVFAVAQRGKSGPPRLTDVGQLSLSQPLPPLSEPERRHIAITEALQGKFDKRKQGEMVVVSRQREAKVHFAWLPSVDPEELDRMARFELEKIVPMEADRYVASHIVTGQHDEGSECMVVALDSAAADCLARGAKHASVAIDRTTLAGWTIYQAWRHARDSGALKRLTDGDDADAAEYNGANSAGDPLSPGGGDELLLYLGIDSADVILLRDGRPFFMRSSHNGLTKMLVNLRRSGLHLGLDDFEHLDLEQIDFSILGIRDRHAKAGEAAPAEAESEDDALYDSTPGTPIPEGLSRPGDDERLGDFLRRGEGGEPDAAPRSPQTSQVLAVGEDVSMWGGGEGEIVRTYLRRVTQELKRTITFASTNLQLRRLNAITLCGPGAAFRKVDRYFKTNFGVPVAILDGFAGVELQLEERKPAARKAGKIEEGKGENSGETIAPTAPEKISAARRQLYLDAVGAAIESLEIEPERQLDLTPLWYREQRAAGEQRRSIATTVTIALIALLLCFIYFQVRQGFRRDLIESIQAENARMEPLAERAQEMQEKLEVVQQNVSYKYSALTVLDMLAELDVFQQQRVRLERFNFERGEDVFLGGLAKQVRDVNDLLFGLKRSGFFRSVELRDQKSVQLSGNREAQQFDIIATLGSQIPGASRGRALGGQRTPGTSRPPSFGGPTGLRQVP